MLWRKSVMSSLFVLNPVLVSVHGRAWTGCRVPLCMILHGSADPRLSTLCHVARMLFSAIRPWMEAPEQVPAVSLCVSSADTLCQPSVRCRRCHAGVGEPSCQLQSYSVCKPIAPPEVSPLHVHVYYIKFLAANESFLKPFFFFIHHYWPTEKVCYKNGPVPTVSEKKTENLIVSWETYDSVRNRSLDSNRHYFSIKNS